MTLSRVLAIGGSTGAIPVLKRLMSELPASLPVPVFIVVHVGAQGRDLLASILDTCGLLPVETARDGTLVEPGRVYIAPADHHLLVIDDCIRLGRGPRENMSRPAVDALFRSVAASYGSRAVGLLLTGQLNDGAAGLATIKQCGGTTVVQDPVEAVAPDMPLSALRASDIDYRSRVDDLGELVTMLASTPPDPATVIPQSVELEVDIALGRPCLTATIEEIADVAPLSCPACGGCMSQIREKPLRFRCQVGHGYTAEALMAEQVGSLDEAVRIALRIVEERAVLVERMAQDAQISGRSHAQNDLQKKALELRSYGETLRTAALHLAESSPDREN